MTDDERTILDLLPEPTGKGILLTKLWKKLPLEMSTNLAWAVLTELRIAGLVEYYDVPVDGGTRLVYRRTGVAA